MVGYDEKKTSELVTRIRNSCLVKSKSHSFPFKDHKLIMHPHEKHVNFRVIRAAIDAIIKETSLEIVPAITTVVNEIYDRFAIPEVTEALGYLDMKNTFNLSHKYALTDNKGPFKSADAEMETLWMSYESYQIYNWICESISNDPDFLFNANLIGTEKDKNIQRLMKTSLTPELTYKYGVPKYARTYNNTIQLRPLEVKPGRVIYEFRVIDRFQTRSNCDNFRRGERITQGKLAYVPIIFGLKEAKINSIEMMGDGFERGVYEILYEKSLPRKFWDMSLGLIWTATIGKQQILEEQVIVAETERDKYLELSRSLEDRVEERTQLIEKQKAEIEVTNSELVGTLTNLKLAQSQLVQSEKMASLGQLVAGIAHEINNPVTFISAGVDSLRINLEEVRQVLDIYDRITPKNIHEKLKVIQEIKGQIDYKQTIREINQLILSIKNGTERTTQIVRGLRTFSRLDEDELKYADVNDGLDSTLTLLHYKYKNRIEIIKKYDDIPLLECFPGQLNQVFMNILSNAIDSIEDKGKIIINTSLSEGFIRISIKDNGRGILEDIREKIFDPFFTTKGVGKGTGLGLSITQSIIEKHNGNIEVKSEIDKGSEFIVILPLKKTGK